MLLKRRLQFALTKGFNVFQAYSNNSISSTSSSSISTMSSIPPYWNTIIQKAQDWANDDPNEITANYIKNLIEDNDDDERRKELESLFPISNERIAFGTAGLRSSMKPGPLHMNDLVVVQAAQGIARYCQQVFATTTTTKSENKNNPSKLGVVIGYDHRANTTFGLSSLSFALLTTLVFQEAGFDDCFLLDGIIATPLIPYTVNQLNQVTNDDNPRYYTIGIMITASHNPKEDAGYKVYWNDGCQIRSPIDTGMAKFINDNLIPWTNYRDKLTNLRKIHTDDPCLGLSNKERTKKIIDSYFNSIKESGLVTGQAKLLKDRPNQSNSPPRFCYTAMHGVGYKFAKRAFDDVFEFSTPFFSVESQQEPDPTFPTVPFPNPEEKGALDLAKVFASSDTVNCDIILANDPDADRLAVGEKCRTTGEWTVFTGDQIGVMLGHWLWESIGKKHVAATGQPIAMCASTASSKMLGEIARVEGFHFEDTLTGFKWIGSKAAELHTSGKYRTLFCYEEAIGFCCGNVVFDKDGITALCVFAELALYVYHQSTTGSLKRHLQSLYDKYGEFVSNNGYYFVSDPSITRTIFNAMTNNGTCDNLDTVGPYKVVSIRYLGEPGYDSSQPDKKPTLPTSASSPMLTLAFENGCVAQFRGSGTEPKFKYYIELKGQPGVSQEIVSTELLQMSDIILQELLQPSKYGLRKPS